MPLFASELAKSLPRIDPWPGIYHGDELRVVGASQVLPHLDSLLRKYDRKLFRQCIDSEEWNRLVVGNLDFWSSGDSAIVLRLRRNRLVTLVFWERESQERVYTRFNIGNLDRSQTGVQALYDIGIREIAAVAPSPRHAANLKTIGYVEASVWSAVLVMRMDKRP